MSETNLQKFKKLLEELFMFDQADLDFGIYRIMNAKRGEITRFLDNDLLPQVKQTLASVGDSDRAALKEELEKAIVKAKELGADPETTPKVKDLRQQLAAKVDLDKLENEVFSNLYDFFRRYYDEGDFLSLRRYKEGVYAIPYEGEEVKLHWANADQYYIKTSEYFRDYTFKLGDGRRVHFKIASADTEKDNVKATPDKDRRFLLVEESPVTEENGELIIRFEYRPDEQRRKQAAINQETSSRILSSAPAAWHNGLATLSPTEKNPQRTFLDKHLSEYSARNTFDYFIHKDLGGFLRRELDFYIKNEIIHLDDIENEAAPRVEQYLIKIKAIRSIAHKIIDFLAQLEDFQKKLWLKKKFVIEAQYCITLGSIPENFYAQISANDEQRNEWVKLFTIDEIEGDLTTPGYSVPLTAKFLKAHRTLVVDTRHFNSDFTERLLNSMGDIDEQSDGTLFHSENFQALSLMRTLYRDSVKCIYIDPPFNTDANAILYKNSYRHSSWLSLMQSRLLVSRSFEMSETGVHIVAIDKAEQSQLAILLREIWNDREITCVSIIHNPSGTMGKNFSSNGEYAMFVYDDGRIIIGKENRNENPDIRDLMNTAKGTSNNYLRASAKDCFYPIIIKNMEIVGFGEVCQEDFHPSQNVLRKDGAIEVYPIDNDGVERKWVLSVDTVEEHLHELFPKRDSKTGNIWIERQKSAINFKTIWIDSKYSAKKYGTELLGEVIPETRLLPRLYPKSIHLVKDCVRAGTAFDTCPIVLDYFAGSGTTGHSIIEMNREDGNRRRFILVEMGNHFDEVLLPRIKKATFSPEWKDGSPKRAATREEAERGPRILKVLRLESYEDTLNNLTVTPNNQQSLILKDHPSLKEDFTLRYMLETETAGSPSLLNVDRFDDPFNYKLKIATGSVGETMEVNVDLVETFNYLIGLRVKHIDSIKGIKIVQGTNPTDEKVLVIWRNVKETPNAALDEFFLKQKYNTRDMEFDIIYVNGDNNLENLKRPDDTWKVRLIEEDFLHLMFDVEDV